MPTNCSHIGAAPQGSSPTYEQAHVGLDLLILASYNKKINEEGGYCNEWTSGTRHGLFISVAHKQEEY